MNVTQAAIRQPGFFYAKTPTFVLNAKVGV